MPTSAPTPEPLDSRLDLQPLWQRATDPEPAPPALDDPWGRRHRPDWAARGLIIWPRGGLTCRLQLHLACPPAWRERLQGRATARLCLRWWAEAAELRVDGVRIHRGDLFDTACRWPLPRRWWQGAGLDLELLLRSPCHDDGALIHSRLELEPCDPADPDGLLAPVVAELEQRRREAGLSPQPGPGPVRLLGHAHLDLAWLWPVADTWRAAERTFTSVLALMDRWPELRFGHSTPALYAWLEQHRPALFARLRAAMRAGRWEPLNGPWVESDCQLIDTASLLRQFQLGQDYSRTTFPEWSHALAWLPDSFGFSAGLPAVAAATGVRWFCTHKLAWNATHPFPHRLFRWRSRCGAELVAVMTAPIGTDGDPVAIETHRLAWQRATGVPECLWLPGVGDHGGGPTAEMLEQLELWQQQAAMAPLQHGTLRQHLEVLEPLLPRLPIWRDELYLELHRGCATSRPDQKRHNRTLERLLREAELVRSLLLACRSGPGDRTAPMPARPGLGWMDAAALPVAAGPGPSETETEAETETVASAGAMAATATKAAAAAIQGDAVDWRPLLFQQFHDILPGTSIPEVFEQAEPQWRAARRRARRQRDQALLQGLGRPPGGEDGQLWWAAQLQSLPAAPRCVRLPAGTWQLATGPDRGAELPGQPAPEGGVWLQLPVPDGVSALALQRRRPDQEAPAAAGLARSRPTSALAIAHPVQLRSEADGTCWLDNGLVRVRCGPDGVEQLWDGAGEALLAAPLRWCRWRDRGEFWDAWDLAADHRDHPLPWSWQAGARIEAAGPLCSALSWRGRCGSSPVRLTVRLLAGSPWLELQLSLHWQQRHELLQLEIPLARPMPRWAADCSGGVIERPARALTPAEQSRWEVTAISWIAAPELAVLLDGPQGVSATPERLGVSLLRAPTWPDPGADNGWQRLRLALLPARGGWRAARVPQQARRLREPLWLHPAPPAGALPAGPAVACSPDPEVAWPGFPALGDDLRLVGLRPGREPGTVLLTVQNEGPCRRWLDLPPPWRVLQRLDGLGDPALGDPLVPNDQTSPADRMPQNAPRQDRLRQDSLREEAPPLDPLRLDPLRLDPWRLNPWQLAFWSLRVDAGL
ncbi:MAG: alpha-mannosidase [Cyanobium sp.]